MVNEPCESGEEMVQAILSCVFTLGYMPNWEKKKKKKAKIS